MAVATVVVAAEVARVSSANRLYLTALYIVTSAVRWGTL